MTAAITLSRLELQIAVEHRLTQMAPKMVDDIKFRGTIDSFVDLIERENRAHELNGATGALVTYATAIEQSSNPDAVVTLSAVATALRRSAHRIKQSATDRDLLEAIAEEEL